MLRSSKQRDVFFQHRDKTPFSQRIVTAEDQIANLLSAGGPPNPSYRASVQQFTAEFFELLSLVIGLARSTGHGSVCPINPHMMSYCIDSDRAVAATEVNLEQHTVVSPGPIEIFEASDLKKVVA